MMQSFDNFVNRVENWMTSNPGRGVRLLGGLRVVLLISLLLLAILSGGVIFERVEALKEAKAAQQISPLLQLLPVEWIAFFIYVFTWDNLRFVFPLVGAIISIFIAAGFYVKDIYNLKNFTDGLRYVLASMFASNLPHVLVANGQMEMVNKKEANLIADIGGPGYCEIQPGNAVLFRQLRQITRNIMTQSVLLTRFESVASISNLDNQEDLAAEVNGVTRDGIQVKVHDVRYQFRILSEERNGVPMQRSTENPYPFSRQAFIDMAFYLSVNDSGQISWNTYVRQQVTGVVEDYINDHTIDELTAPRTYARDPRQEIRQLMFGPGLTGRLRLAGTRLLWVDIGNFEIIAEEVDRERVNLWAAEWVGDAGVRQAAIEARRLHLQELGRAEGQAEMLMGIAEALQGLDIGKNRAQNIRRMLLARTAQILDAMRDNRSTDQKK